MTTYEDQVVLAGFWDQFSFFGYQETTRNGKSAHSNLPQAELDFISRTDRCTLKGQGKLGNFIKIWDIRLAPHQPKYGTRPCPMLG